MALSQLYPIVITFLLLIFSQSVFTFPYHNIPIFKLSSHDQLHKQQKLLSKHILFNQSVPLSTDFKTYFYLQTTDHFNYGPTSYNIFRQKYIINDKYWGGAKNNSPILAYFGGEGPVASGIDVFNDVAHSLKALLVFIEHRYYGESNPLGSMEKAMENDTIRGYLNSAQALADFAEILLHIKKSLLANESPILVVGGSYGGMLAAWFRLKYPHISLGALASSAPILYFDNITPQDAYYSIVSKDFKETSENCYRTIKQSWAEIDRVASKHNGLAILSQRFNTCSQLNNSGDLKGFLKGVYQYAALYGTPTDNLVSTLCKGIDKASSKKTDIIGRVWAGIAYYFGDNECWDVYDDNPPSETSLGWGWQRCSEMVMPIGTSAKNTMFQAAPFDIHKFNEDCKGKYGVSPRPYWITTYYGGHDIKLVLKRFGSNIIFSNGLRDPYSAGGVLEDLSESLVAITTLNGSHCLDLHPPAKGDPEWRTAQRKKEVEIMKGWLNTYYSDLQHA